MSVPVRHEWYQSDSKVVITILLKNAVDKNYKVEILRDSVEMKADDNCNLRLQLFRPIVVERSIHKATPSKVEISLAKEASERWEDLEAKPASAPSTAAANQAPTSVFHHNWDKLAKEIEKDEAGDDRGEEALQELFKKIYSDSSPEVKMAMNKSFSESGGTVLSTNWKEVAKQKVDVKPPDGAEFKKWE